MRFLLLTALGLFFAGQTSFSRYFFPLGKKLETLSLNEQAQNGKQAAVQLGGLTMGDVVVPGLDVVQQLQSGRSEASAAGTKRAQTFD